MNHILSATVLAFSSNVDNLSVAVAYGIMPRKIYFHHNLLIAVVTGSGTWLSMSAGEWVNNYMSEGFANTLGSVIMILIGLYNVVQAIRIERNRFKGNEKAENDLREGTHSREAFALAVSLTFNNRWRLGCGDITHQHTTYHCTHDGLECIGDHCGLSNRKPCIAQRFKTWFGHRFWFAYCSRWRVRIFCLIFI